MFGGFNNSFCSPQPKIIDIIRVKNVAFDFLLLSFPLPRVLVLNGCLDVFKKDSFFGTTPLPTGVRPDLPRIACFSGEY